MVENVENVENVKNGGNGGNVEKKENIEKKKIKGEEELEEYIKEKVESIRKIAPMNEELKKWIEEKGEKISSSSLKKEEPLGKCEICGRKAKHRCIKCRRGVCTSCYWTLFGLCKECAPENTIEKWKDKTGIDWVE